MTKLIPGEKLIYERVDDIVYARYANRPEIDRWVIGGNPQKNLFEDFNQWRDIIDASKNCPTLKKALDKVETIWYTIKDETEKETSTK